MGRVNKFEVALERRGSLLQTLRMGVALLSTRERRRGVVVLGMVALMALLETAGVASVMPFLAVLGNPGIIDEVAALRWAFDALGFQSKQSFLWALGIASAAVIVLSSVFKAFTHYVMHRYTYMRRHSISERLLASYLRQPYEFFLNRNSAVLSKTVLSETDQLMTYVFKPAMTMVAYGVTLAAIVMLLVIIDPFIALAVGGVVGGAYLSIYLAVRDMSSRFGRDRVVANKARFKTASEALGGIKDVKILGHEEAYIQRFRGPSKRFSRLQTNNSVVAEVPKFIVEAVGYGGLIVLTLLLMGTRDELGSVLSILGLYAFAGYRLMPAAQQVYASIAKLRFGFAVVELIHQDFAARQPEMLSDGGGAVVTIQDAIKFDCVSFRYPGAHRDALTQVDIRIPANSTVGIIGRTGAGKTTVIDLLLGLLMPTSGKIVIDGIPLGPGSLRAWRRTIGYVPQQIFLSDASVAENIAFGVPYENIDHAAVERAARAAQLHDFITDELSDGYATVVGERGIRLSGGQRQRIGVARALYRDPAVIVLDEATSALDTRTEAAVMSAIKGLSGQKTIVMIAHRLSTVRDCDVVYALEGGSVIASGPLSEIEQLVEATRENVRR